MFSVAGMKFFFLLKDDVTGFRVSYFLKHKNETAECIKHHVRMMETQTGNKSEFSI